MDIQNLKLDLVQRLLATKDISVLTQIRKLLDKETPVAFTVDGKAITRKQLYKDLKEAEKEIDNGSYFTIDGLLEDSESW